MNESAENITSRDEPSAEELIEYARSQAEQSDLADLPLAAFQLPPDLFPGYTLEEEVHRGGQGVVYRATHHATRRQVAVKAIRLAPLAAAHEKARFEREVQVLGRLKHANIVALHDGGVSNGLGFLVTDYVEGVTLDEFVRARNLSTEELLGLFAKVCHAVSAAHVRGIVHRDLKPSNVRVDEHGEPHILDFGLAKLSMPGDAAGERVTMTGQFVGSLPWAAPEQAEGAGDKIDIRTDVYALGVILFHLLTGRFPYDVSGTMREVVERIVNASPSKPSAFRPGVGDDLDTITLKCLSKEPDRRYQSAGELARDVERCLAGEAIEAKRDSTWYVLRKTVKRNRGLAIGIGVVAVLTVAYAITVTLLYRRAIQAEHESAKHAAASQAKFEIARDALSFLVGEVSERLRTTSGGREARKAILEGAYEKLKLLTEVHGDATLLLPDLARAHSELGDIALMVGNSEQARTHFETALSIHRELANAEPENIQRQDDLSIAIVRMGDTVKAIGDFAGARKYYEDAFEIDKTLAVVAPADAHLLDNLAWSYQRICDLAHKAGEFPLAEQYAQEQLQIAERAAALEPDNPTRLWTLAAAHRQLALLARSRGDVETGLAEAERAVALLGQIVAIEPSNAFYAGQLSGTQFIVVEMISDQGRVDEAFAMLRERIGIAEKRIEDDPSSLDNLGHAPAYGLLASLERERGNVEAMARHARRAHELASRYVGVAPEDPWGWHFLVGALYGLSEVAFEEHRPDDVRRYLEDALAIADKVSNSPQHTPDVLSFNAELLLDARVQDLRDLAKALELAKRAAAITGHGRPDMLLVLGKAYHANGQTGQAIETLEHALTLVAPGDSPLRRDIEASLREYSSPTSEAGEP